MKLAEWWDNDEVWPTLHKYRRYATLDLVEPWRCTTGDDEELVLFVRKDTAEPVLKCFNCGTVFGIGDIMYRQMVKTIDYVEKEIL